MPSVTTRRSPRQAKLSGETIRLRRAGGAVVRAVALTAIVTMLATLVTSGVASASTKGSPQPELALFKVAPGSSSGSGSGAVLPDGTLVLAAPSSSALSINVCMLHPGGRTCAAASSLHVPSMGAQWYGTVQVLATGGKDVSVVAEDLSGAVVFNSTNDGRSFGHGVLAGSIGGIDTGVYADGQIVVANASSGTFNVQAFSPNATTKQPQEATPNNREVYNSSLTTWKRQLLVASDDTNGNTVVESASFGSNFNSSSSYSKNPIVIKQEDLDGISGNALLTDGGGSLTGGTERLYFWNGTGFGTGHKVPEPKNGDDGYWSIQETGSVVHVFFLNRRNGYDIYAETTTNGVNWSPLTVYNTAITSDLLAPVLAPQGWGLVFECDTSGSSLAQPILLPQHVHISLQHSTVKVGTSTKLEGTVSPKLAGQLVTLQRLAGKVWDNVGTSHESASGTFSFSVPGKAETYRAVVDYKPGEYLYGYSNSVTLKTVRT